jgi:hypothetical protein
LCVKQLCGFYPAMFSQLRYPLVRGFRSTICCSFGDRHKMEGIQVLYSRAMASPTKAFWDWGWD